MKNEKEWNGSESKEINGKIYFSCVKRRNGRTTWVSSAYKYECELCIHAVDRFGNEYCKKNDDDYAPRKPYCPYPECPYKADFEQRKIDKQKMFEKLLKEFKKNELDKQ